MSRVLLCYDPWSLARNVHFARALREGLERHFGSCSLSMVGPGDRPALAPDTAIAIARSRDRELRRWLADRLPVVVNPPLLALIGNDKLATARWLAEHELPGPPTTPSWLAHRAFSATDLVVKPRAAHGGHGVRVVPADTPPRCDLDAWITQAFVPGGERVLRAYVVGSTIAAWTERRAADGVAANLSRGASGHLATPTRESHRLATRVMGLIGPGYYGIDLFERDDDVVVNEIEDVVGARTLARAGIDVVDLVVQAVAHSAVR